MDTTRDTDSDIGRRVEAWVDAGIISPEQGHRIRDFEVPPRTRRRSVVPEVLGYVGAALVAVAAIVLVSDIWDDIGRTWQIVLCGTTAAGLSWTAIVVGRRDGDRTARRLARSTLLLATVPAGIAVALTADLVLPEAVAVVVGFLGATAFATVWYRRDHSWAQHLALFGAVLGTALTVEPATDLDAFLWVTAPIVFSLGAVWVTAATRDVLPPRTIGQVLGSGALGFGSVLLVAAADPETTLGLVMLGLMILVSITCLAVGARVDAVVLIGTGVVGLLGYVPWFVTEVFGNTLGVPIGLAIAGAALLGAMSRLRT